MHKFALVTLWQVDLKLIDNQPSLSCLWTHMLVVGGGVGELFENTVGSRFYKSSRETEIGSKNREFEKSKVARKHA